MRLHLAAGMFALLAGAGATRLWGHPPHAPASRQEGSARERAPHFARQFDVSRFVRGNLHTHTNRSDGDASPLDVATWYRDHGYGFVALTDHNRLSDLLETAPIASPDFALIPGEEVSMWVHGTQVHVNALCTQTVVAGGEFISAKNALAHAIDDIRAQHGVALINHPNFVWALSETDVSGAEGEALLEIASGHPYVHTHGDAAHPSHEALWDAALTAGHDVMGVAVDDTHHLATDAEPEAFPGVAWVMVFAEAPREDAICEALRQGALYASTGGELRRIAVSDTTYVVEPVSADSRVMFIGSKGRELARGEPGARTATYRLKGDEGYVRARVETANGLAWTPAVRVTGRER